LQGDAFCRVPLAMNASTCSQGDAQSTRVCGKRHNAGFNNFAFTLMHTLPCHMHVAMPHARVAMPLARIAMSHAHVAMSHACIAVPHARVAMPLARIAMSHALVAMSHACVAVPYAYIDVGTTAQHGSLFVLPWVSFQAPNLITHPVPVFLATAATCLTHIQGCSATLMEHAML